MLRREVRLTLCADDGATHRSAGLCRDALDALSTGPDPGHGISTDRRAAVPSAAAAPPRPGPRHRANRHRRRRATTDTLRGANRT